MGERWRGLWIQRARLSDPVNLPRLPIGVVEFTLLIGNQVRRTAAGGNIVWASIMSRRRKSKELAVAEVIVVLVAFGMLCVMFAPKLAGMLLLVLIVGLVLLVGFVVAVFFLKKQTQSPPSMRVNHPVAASFDPAQQSKRSPGNTFSYGRQKPPPPAAGGTSTSGDKPARDAGALAPNLSSAERVRQALRSLDWFQFEKLITMYYQTQGYSVRRVGGAKPDGGVDLILEHENQRYVIQCKHWKKWTVGVRQMREFLGTMTDTGIPNGIYVTTCGYTDEARDFASKHGIQLFAESQVVQCVLAMEATQRQVVGELLADRRKFCPRCENEMVLRVARKGSNAGGEFWGCSRYPRCKYILNADEKE